MGSSVFRPELSGGGGFEGLKRLSGRLFPQILRNCDQAPFNFDFFSAAKQEPFKSVVLLDVAEGRLYVKAALLSPLNTFFTVEQAMRFLFQPVEVFVYFDDAVTL